MSQRFGGLFSTLSQRDYSALVFILQSEEDDYLIPELETLSAQGLYWLVDYLEDKIREEIQYLSKYQAVDGPVPSGHFTGSRQELAVLQTLKRKIRGKLKGRVGESRWDFTSLGVN